MVRNTLQVNECQNQPYSILKQILQVKYKALQNNAILDPFAACLYSEGRSGIQKVFDTVFFCQFWMNIQEKTMHVEHFPTRFIFFFTKERRQIILNFN